MPAQVYVSVSKRAVLDTLGLPPEYEALLTTDDRARLHAVPLWRVSLKHMARTLKHYRGRYTTIVGFQPTGWSMQSGVCSPTQHSTECHRCVSVVDFVQVATRINCGDAYPGK